MEQLQTEHGIFTNNEITGQTAQEVYQEWLSNRDNPLQPPTEIELLGQQNTDLEIQSIMQGQHITDLEIQNIMLGQMVTDMELKILRLEMEAE